MLPINETALHFILNKYEKLHIMQYHILTTNKKQEITSKKFHEKMSLLVQICWNSALIDRVSFRSSFVVCAYPLCGDNFWRILNVIASYLKGNYSNWEMFCTIWRLCQYSFKKTVHVRLPCWCYCLTFHDAFLICWRHFRDVLSYNITSI